MQSYPGPDGKLQISTEGGTEPVRNCNGRELFYRNGDDPEAHQWYFAEDIPNVRNQEGSEEILRNCDETWRGTIVDLPVSPIASVLDPEREVQRWHSGSSMTLIQRGEHELEHEPRENRRIPVLSRPSDAASFEAERSWE